KGPNDVGLSRKHIMESIDASLGRLRTDYVDLYQAHRFDYETPLEETMLAFADVVRAGKALYIGVSEWTAEQIEAGSRLARELHIPLVSNQPHYNMLWRVIEPRVVPVSRTLGLSQIVWSPMEQGLLTGKYLPGKPVPPNSRAASKVGAGLDNLIEHDQKTVERVQGLRPIADELGITMAQLAIAWVLQNDNVAAALVGASRPEQVTSNVGASGVKIPPELMSRIDEVLGDSVQRDPELTVTTNPRTRPGSN
ncbi:MAG: aldo/keto reductase, partial [Propionibacterium sp.]